MRSRISQSLAHAFTQGVELVFITLPTVYLQQGFCRRQEQRVQSDGSFKALRGLLKVPGLQPGPFLRWLRLLRRLDQSRGRAQRGWPLRELASAREVLGPWP